MRLEVTIDGMFAVHARHAVFTALGALEGIVGAEVELGRVVIEHDGRATDAALRDAIAAAGYSVVAIRALPRSLPTL